MEKTVLQTQLALFFRKPYARAFETISIELKKSFGEPKIPVTLLPIPNDAPPEIPRLTMAYEGFNISVSKNRLDFYCAETAKLSSSLDQLFSVLIKELQVEIGRIGFVQNSFVSGTIETLKKNLTAGKSLTGLKEVTIRINQPVTVNGYECNSLETLNLGEIQNAATSERKSGIIITKDINTLLDQEKAPPFSTDSMKLMLSGFIEAANKLLLILE